MIPHGTPVAAASAARHRRAMSSGDPVAPDVEEIGDLAAGGQAQLVGPRRSERDPRDPVAVGADDEVVGDLLGEQHPVDQLPQRYRRNVLVRVDLAVRVGDRGADLGTAVLEHEHVVDVVAGAERRGALRPVVDDGTRARRSERPELGVVVGGVEDHLAAVVGHGRPAVHEPADDVGFGGLEPADAERAVLARAVRAPLTAADHDGGVAGQRVGPHLRSVGGGLGTVVVHEAPS